MLIPAYQPNEILYKLVCELAELKFRIFVVNDGSDDLEAVDVFKKISTLSEVITLKKNAGKGAAIKAGLKRIKQLNLKNSQIVTLDADGQHQPLDAVKVLKKLQNSDADLVLGIRSFFKERIPFRSVFGNFLTSFLLFCLKRRVLVDTQTGLRAFPYRIISELLDISEMNYDWEFAVLNKFLSEKKKISTCEIKTIYEVGNPSSHFKKVADSAKIYFVFLKYSLANIFAIAIEYFIFITLTLLGFSIFLALSASRVTSLIVHFTAQKNFTFNQKSKPERRQIGGYALLAAFNYLISLALLTSLQSYFISTLLLKIVVDLGLSLITFSVLYKLFSNK